MTEFEGIPPRIDADPESVERGLVTLVLTLVELLRQLMERQALRRVDEGDLSDEQIERIGTTLMLLEERMGGVARPLRAHPRGSQHRPRTAGDAAAPGVSPCRHMPATSMRS